MAEQIRSVPGVKVAMSIGGSDSSGGAGIQAHLKTFSVMGVYGATAITAITAQNTDGVKKAQVLDPELVDAQINAVAGDLPVQATLTSMLGNAAVAKAVAAAIKRNNLQPLVVDPVMISKHGDALVDDQAIKVICDKLLPLAAVVTPNRREAARLLGQAKPIEDVGSAAAAAKAICDRFGAKACIVKGIRRPTGEEGEAVDLYYDGSTSHEIVAEWRNTPNTHGSGCTFAAAITAGLALGLPIEQAVPLAKTVVSEAIRQQTGIGHGPAPVNHLAYLDLKKKK